MKAKTTKKAVKRPAAAKVLKKPAEGFTRWDITDDMKTERDITGYIEAFLEEVRNDPEDVAAEYLVSALGDVARAYGMMQLARDTGISREGLYRALGRDGNPSLSTLLKVLRAFGLRLELGYADTKKKRAA